MMEWTEKTPIAAFEDPEGGSIIVFPYCPKCGKFIKRGQVFTNGIGETTFENWVCKKHGEVSPNWTRGE